MIPAILSIVIVAAIARSSETVTKLYFIIPGFAILAAALSLLLRGGVMDDPRAPEAALGNFIFCMIAGTATALITRWRRARRLKSSPPPRATFPE